MSRGALGPSFVIKSESVQQTRALGGALARLIEPGDVILLVGELGAGKTMLVKGLVNELDADLEVTSPTFVLCHVYETTPVIAHVDCWRLGGVGEVIDLGLEEVVDDGGVVVIEWGELAEPILGSDALVVTFHASDEHESERSISLSCSSTLWSSRLRALRSSLADVGLNVKASQGSR